MYQSISIEELLNEVEITLSSYFQSGIIDTTLLYPHVRRCLGLIGVKVLPIKETQLLVENYGVALPGDFFSLILLLSTDTKNYAHTPPQGLLTFERKHLDTVITHDDNNIPLINEFNRYSVVQRTNIELLTSTTTKIPIIGNHIPGCVNPYNAKKYDLEIKNNRILTQFESGVLHMEYRADSEDIMIPDFPEIIEWLKAECIKLCFSQMYYNTTEDVVQRLQFSSAELHILKENARTFWKRHSVAEFNQLKKYLQDNFNKTSLLSTNQPIHSKYNNYSNNIHNR
jgi:hypothetical protein